MSLLGYIKMKVCAVDVWERKAVCQHFVSVEEVVSFSVTGCLFLGVPLIIRLVVGADHLNSLNLGTLEKLVRGIDAERLVLFCYGCRYFVMYISYCLVLWFWNMCWGT